MWTMDAREIICRKCFGPKEPGGSLCHPCAERARKDMHELYAERKAASACPKCGKLPYDRPGGGYCIRCHERQAERKTVWKIGRAAREARRRVGGRPRISDL